MLWNDEAFVSSMHVFNLFGALRAGSTFWATLTNYKSTKRDLILANGLKPARINYEILFEQLSQRKYYLKLIATLFIFHESDKNI